MSKVKLVLGRWLGARGNAKVERQVASPIEKKRNRKGGKSEYDCRGKLMRARDLRRTRGRRRNGFDRKEKGERGPQKMCGLQQGANPWQARTESGDIVSGGR